MGTNKMIKKGVVKEMTTSTDKQLNKLFMNVRNVSGILFSVHSMSLLKRLRIRPTGVLSKNDIPLRSMEWSSMAWNFFDVFSATLAKNISAKKTSRPIYLRKKNQNIFYIYFRCTVNSR